MKTILVATDFSRASSNAVKYAVDIARFNNASLIIYNVFEEYIPLSTYDVVPVEMVDLRKYSLRKLKNVLNRTRILYPKLDVRIDHNEGIAHEQIQAYAIAKKVDMVVVAVHNSGIIERIMGTTGAAMVRNAEFPVLAVPTGSRFHPLRKILFTHDLKTIDAFTVKWVKQMALLYSADVDILCLVNDMLLFQDRIQEEKDKIAEAFKGIHPEIFFSEAENFTFGIDSFVNKHKAGLIITRHHLHSFLYRIFNQSVEQELVFHLTIPMLSLPEGGK